jgi:pimeloyl-ACP methyl ester carboxylesterase
MGQELQLRWFAGLAGAARLGWKAPHFQSRQLARRLGRVTAPVLVVSGERDVLVPTEAARAWVEALPAARLTNVADAGHCLPLERPDIAGEVLAFVSGPGQ